MANELLTQEQQNPAVAFARKTVDVMKNQWAQVLPKICTPDRFARIALSCINKNPVLGEALQTPLGKTTILSALMTCAEMGIEPDGRRAHLIAFKKGKNTANPEYQIQLIFDYKGLTELAMRSGMISCIHADKICENDDFEWNIGKIEKHKPNFKGERGKPFAYYCHVQFKDGAVKDEVMTIHEIEAVRNRSAAWQAFLKYKKECPWVTDPEEMAKKTVFRRCSKWLPLSPEFRDAVEKEDEYENETIDVHALSATSSRFERIPSAVADEESAPTAPASQPSDLDRLRELIAERNIPVTAEQVREFVEKNGELFRFPLVEPNIDAIAEAILNGGE